MDCCSHQYLVSSALKVHYLKTKTKDSVRIKGSLFVDLPKSYQKPRTKKDLRRAATEGKCNFTKICPFQLILMMISIYD